MLGPLRVIVRELLHIDMLRTELFSGLARVCPSASLQPLRSTLELLQTAPTEIGVTVVSEAVVVTAPPLDGTPCMYQYLVRVQCTVVLRTRRTLDL